MPDKAEKSAARAEKFSALVNAPFVPEFSVDPGARIAHAMDYIAAQLHQINQKLDKLTDDK